MANNYQSIASNFRKDPINNTIVSKPIIQPDVISPNSSGIVPMWEIPEVRNRVKVMNADGTYKVECFNAKDITEEKYFYVDYALGDCYFHKNELGKAITIAYRGIGNSSLYAGRVYTKLGEDGDVSETIQDIITKGRASIDFYNSTGSAIELLANLTTKNTEALVTISTLNTAIGNGDIITMKTNVTNLQTLTSTLSTNKVNKTESGLSTTSKDIVTSINEVNAKADTKQSSTDATLTTTSKTIVGGINELKTALSTTNTNITNVDNSKQNKTDNTLLTTSKTVSGGINEIFAIVNGSRLLAESGYQKLDNGLIIQWGICRSKDDTSAYYGVTSITLSTARTTFPISFPNACFMVFPSAKGNTEVRAESYAWVKTRISDKNGAEFRLTSPFTSSWEYVEYFAIGY